MAFEKNRADRQADGHEFESGTPDMVVSSQMGER
jgi:hypothetical protein